MAMATSGILLNQLIGIDAGSDGGIGDDQDTTEKPKFKTVSQGAEAFSFSGWNENGPLTRKTISSFLNQYGPIGNNSLNSDESGLLFNVAMAMTRKQFQPGSAIGMKVKHLISSHMNDVAARSGINHQVDGNGNPDTSGHTVKGYSSSNYYQITAQTGRVEVVADPTEVGGDLDDLIEQGLTDAPPEKDFSEPEVVEEEVINSNPIVGAKTGGFRGMDVSDTAFRSSAAYRSAYAQWQTSKMG